MEGADDAGGDRLHAVHAVKIAYRELPPEINGCTPLIRQLWKPLPVLPLSRALARILSRLAVPLAGSFTGCAKQRAD